MNGNSLKDFTLYRNAFATMVCFGVNRGFRSEGSISLSDNNFITKPMSIDIHSGSVPRENCFAVASKGTTIPGKYRVQFTFT